MHSNTILVMNGKGGVAKTSVVANLAGLAAASGWRTLAIDTDPQGNLARDLGCIDDTDDGHNLANAILAREPLQPMRNVRASSRCRTPAPKRRRCSRPRARPTMR